MFEGLLTFSYLVGFLGLAACAAAYFMLPKLTRALIKNEDNEDDNADR